MKLRHNVMTVLACSALLLPAAAEAIPRFACSANTTVATGYGKVCGIEIDDVVHYLGIQYAAPPLIDPKAKIDDDCLAVTPSPKCLRFKPPQAPAPWTAIRAAIHFSPACPQQGVPQKDQSEDCLYLNVYRPDDAQNWPVMVFIHGGAFQAGTASLELFDGAALAKAGKVVVVDFNYRLGTLGFLAANDNNTQHSLTGNYGFLDQQFALQWVQDNIAAFGGDRSKVTIFGQSAGAMSVGLHMVSAPGSKNLFRAGIMESNPLANVYQTPDQMAQYQGKKMTSALSPSVEDGCTDGDVRCFYKAGVEDIVKAETSFFPPSGGLLWAPVLDGTHLSDADQPMRLFSALEKPLVFGTTHDEGIFFTYYFFKNKVGHQPWPNNHYAEDLDLAYGLTNGPKVLAQYPCTDDDCRSKLAEALTASSFTCANRYAAQLVPATTAVWGYQFNAVSNFAWPVTSTCVAGQICPCSSKVCHSAELPYVFGTPGTLDHCGAEDDQACSFNKGQQQLSQAMLAYWTGFATGLAPIGGPVGWPKFDSYLYFDATASQQNITPSGADPFHDTCCFWENLGIYGPVSAGCKKKSERSSGWKKGRS
jgi:carboxylesterase type B